MPDEILEVNYGGAALNHYRVGVDANGHDLAIREVVEDGVTLWRFSHVCTSPRSSRTWRIAPLLQIGRGHTVISRDPLHIEASIMCSDCNIHGWVRDGRWVDA